MLIIADFSIVYINNKVVLQHTHVYVRALNKKKLLKQSFIKDVSGNKESVLQRIPAK